MEFELQFARNNFCKASMPFFWLKQITHQEIQMNHSFETTWALFSLLFHLLSGNQVYSLLMCNDCHFLMTFTLVVALSLLLFITSVLGELLLSLSSILSSILSLFHAMETLLAFSSQCYIPFEFITAHPASSSPFTVSLSSFFHCKYLTRKHYYYFKLALSWLWYFITFLLSSRVC